MKNVVKTINAKMEKMMQGSELSAEQAYMQAKYNKPLDFSALYKSFLNEVKDGILHKAQAGHYSYVAEIDEDLQQFLPDIVSHFRDDLGYQVIIINNKTELDGKKLTKINSCFIIFIWNYIKKIAETNDVDTQVLNNPKNSNK